MESDLHFPLTTSSALSLNIRWRSILDCKEGDKDSGSSWAQQHGRRLERNSNCSLVLPSIVPVSRAEQITRIPPLSSPRSAKGWRAASRSATHTTSKRGLPPTINSSLKRGIRARRRRGRRRRSPMDKNHCSGRCDGRIDRAFASADVSETVFKWHK